MISAESLRKTATEILGQYISNGFPYQEVAEKLSRMEEDNNILLSPYGYIMWALDHYGYKCAYKNVLASSGALTGYLEAAKKFRDDTPALLVNAHTYVTKLLSNVADMNICFSKLEDMSFPYVLYTLFAASGQDDVVSRYRKDMVEQMRRYPSTLDLLPESYRNVGKEILDADADKR